MNVVEELKVHDVRLGGVKLFDEADAVLETIEPDIFWVKEEPLHWTNSFNIIDFGRLWFNTSAPVLGGNYPITRFVSSKIELDGKELFAELIFAFIGEDIYVSPIKKGFAKNTGIDVYIESQYDDLEWIQIVFEDDAEEES